MTTDNFPIYLALACAALSLIAYLAGAIMRVSDSERRLMRFARGAYIASFALVAYASVYLLQQILSLNRYDIAYIHDYSGASDELLYRISAFWAGQEGSLLFWALSSGLIGLFLVRRLGGSANAAIAFWCSIQVFFLVLLVVADPFRKLMDYQPGTPGAGLNPLLKNPWMAIHPPILFLGYAALAVPAALALQALVKGDLRDWVTRALPWAVLGWVSLGAGLAMGMAWSYGVLGWGGYWGWDPVENASLVPWLTSTALLHGLVAQKNRGRMAWPNVALALGTFLLVIYATFLTRSGVLANVSVHSFSDLGAYSYLLGFLIAYAVILLGLAVVRRKSVQPIPDALPVPSKDAALAAGAVVFVLFALVVLVGTSLPLFSGSVLKPEFYNRLSVPLGAAVVILMLVASFAGWSRADGKPSGWRFGGSLWKTGSHVAHLGALLVVAGIVLSSFGHSQRMALEKGGESHSAKGWEFSYVGNETVSDGKEVIRITASRGAHTMRIPLTVQTTRQGELWKPYIRPSLTGDLYVAPGDLEQTTITPTAALTDSGWQTVPVKIPGSEATIALTGITVEDRTAKLQYRAPGKPPVDLKVSSKAPASADGYLFTMGGFVRPEAEKGMGAGVGVELSVSGNGLKQRAVIEVSSKPFIWLLWLGTVLIALGGCIAGYRRFGRKA